MNMLFGVMFGIGILFSIYALSEAPKTKDCNASAQNAMRGILVMGVAMTCIAFTALICKCGSSKATHGLGAFFLIKMVCLSIITLVLVSIIKGECKDASGGMTTTMLVLAIIAILVSGGYGGYLIYERYHGAAAENAAGGPKALEFRFHN